MTMTTTATTMMMMRFDGFASRRADARDTNARVEKCSRAATACVCRRDSVFARWKEEGEKEGGGTVGATSGEEDDGDAWEDDYGVDEDYDDPKASSSSLKTRTWTGERR